MTGLHVMERTLATDRYNLLVLPTDLTVGETIRLNQDSLENYNSVTLINVVWLRDELEIEDANNQNYVITDADAGASISVKVEFLSDDGQAETLYSAPIDIPSSGLSSSSTLLGQQPNPNCDVDAITQSLLEPDTNFTSGVIYPNEGRLIEEYVIPQASGSGADVRTSLKFRLGDEKISGLTLSFEDQSGAQSKYINYGNVDLSASTEISNVKIDATAYEADISISDAILNLKHIVGLQTLDGKAALAADADNDGTIGIGDVIVQLKHIVGLSELDTFDVVDSAGNLITDLRNATSSVDLVLNGDIDLSTEVKTNYIYTANEAPTLTVPTGGSVTEDASTSTITGSLTSSDPENDTPSYSVVGAIATDRSYTVTGSYGTLVLNSSTGAYTYTLNNTATAVQTLGGSSSVTETFSVQVTDGPNTPDAQSLSFTIQGANDAPTITVSGLSDIPENTTNAVVATVSATDIEDSSVSIGLSGNGRDDAKFEIVDGKLRIKTSADYEAQETYQVQLSVTDSASVTTLRNLEVGVTDAAEAMSGSVVDGYVAGATIFQDLDNDNVLDAGEPSTTTSSTGEFVLSGIVASKTAPLKMISGFDIGTNQPIVTSLGVPTMLSGNAVASPIATITSISQSETADANLSDVLDRVATYFDISATSQSNANILNDDPITNVASSDSTTANAAKDVFEANQFIMGLTHISEKAGKYLADQIDTAIQSAGDNSYGTYAGGAVSSYEKLGADAFLNTAASHVMTPVAVTSTNSFQIGASQLQWNDYDPTRTSDVTNRVMSSTTGNKLLVGSDAVSLNLQNLINSASASGTYKSPTLSFDLLKVPDGSGSGTLTFNLIDGTDSTRGNGERHINLEVAVNWQGDGNTGSVTIPAQTLSGYYLTSSDLRVDFTISNLIIEALHGYHRFYG